MIDTVSVGDTLRQSGKAKKQLLIRKRLDESIAQARNYEKHPFLPNTVVQVNPKFLEIPYFFLIFLFKRAAQTTTITPKTIMEQKNTPSNKQQTWSGEYQG